MTILPGLAEEILSKVVQAKVYDPGQPYVFGFGRGSEDLQDIEILGKKVLPYLAGE